eukprot:12098999-Karenia_brevis.AAC.1
MVAPEKAAAISAFQDNLETALLSGDPKTAHTAISHILPSKFPAISYLDPPDGTPASSYSEHKLTFRNYFAGILDAKCVSFQHHIDQHRMSYVSNTCSNFGGSKIDINPAHLMSHADLCRKFAKLKPKGLGESCLAGELYA